MIRMWGVIAEWGEERRHQEEEVRGIDHTLKYRAIIHNVLILSNLKQFEALETHKTTFKNIRYDEIHHKVQ